MIALKDQAQKLREMVARRKPVGKYSFQAAAFIAGKGGVGKTTLAANTAVALARMGRRVALWDADSDRENKDRVFGLDSPYDISDVIGGEKSILDIVVEGPSGIKIIPGGLGAAEMTRLKASQWDALNDNLHLLDGMIDFLLINAPAGTPKTIISLLGSFDRVFLVTTTDPLAITEAYLLFKSFKKWQGMPKVELIVNMISGKNYHCDVGRRICSVIRRFLNIEVGVAVEIERDLDVVRAVLRRKPVVLEYPEATFSRKTVALALNLLGDVVGKLKRNYMAEYVS